MSSTTEYESKPNISSATSDDLWVSCDSTSHPGLKFYVNKLTGIKVWNITDSEIAFAEKAGKTSQEPVRHPTMDHMPDARIYNKQIINNQFSNQLSSLLVNPVSVCSPFNVWENQNPAQETYTLVPTALAKAYQQLIPLANSLQNGNLPISYNAQQDQPTRKMSKSARHRNSKWFKNRNRYVQNQSTSKQFPHTHQSPDLRKRLNRRRSLSTTFSENEQDGQNNKEPGPWNDKSHRDNGEWEETSIKMNLVPLKLLTSSGSESDQWYIVVDTDVILNNYNYLNNMATADPDCHLLIPHHVMLELRSLASESSNVQARRIFRFLNEQIQCGLAMMGEEVAGEGPANLAILTCTKLSAQRNQVILISSNPDILKYKSNTKYIHVFTIQDVKDILTNKSARLFRADSPTLALKITVPNDVASQNVEKSGELSDTTFRRIFDSTGFSDKNMCTQKVSGFPEYFEPELHQTPPKLVSQDSTASTSSFMKAHSTENITSLNLSPPKPEHILKNDCSQSPPKARIMNHKLANTVVERNMTTCSLQHDKVCSQSPPKHRNIIPHEELANTDVARTHPEQDFIAYSPSKSVRSSDYISTIASNKNALGVDHNQSPSKSIDQCGYEYSRHSVNQSPLKADNVSCSSSTTSGHVSLDTIRMKSIISMKRLTSANNMQAKRITSNSSKITVKSPEVMKQIVKRDMSASRSSYDNDSETSRTKTIAPNITVEETSLSAISNSESSYSEKPKSSFKKDVKKVSLRSVQMFNVGCQSMEDVLKSRCDEWVFRFVQIMEEVLRVKLQEKLPVDNKEYPAPRDLQEAARNVIKKFSNNFSVVEAANKLSFILYKTSDEDGKIAVNIPPSDYMEMYSYGVFLVDTFQDMSADCMEKNCKKEGIIRPKENQTDSCSCYEVKIASDSLKKLLFDIQNTNLESFVDHPRDLSAENIMPDNDEYDYEFDATEDFQEPEYTEYYDHRSPIQQEDRSEQAANLYNLRSQKRKSQCFEDDEVPPKVTMFGKGYESSYFNSLHLQRTVVFPENIEGNSHVKDMNINKQIVDNQKDTAENKTSDKLQNEDNLQIHFSKEFNNAKLQSKVVCNFTVNADIERKVKARQYEAEYEDYSDNEDITKTSEKFAENKEIEEHIENNGESNENYSFMGSFVRRLGEFFTQVKLLCDDYVKINELTDISTRKELRNKMEMAYLLMGDVRDSLGSISNRDSRNNGKNIQKLLEIAKVKDIPDDKFCLKYRYIINKCKESSEEILGTIRSLLKLVRV